MKTNSLKRDFYLGLVDHKRFQDAKHTAMCRFNVKKNKRSHYDELINEVITLLIESNVPGPEDIEKLIDSVEE